MFLPQGAGGSGGFYGVLEIYRDKIHLEHEKTKIWAEQQYIREDDPKWISIAKNVIYKITEWDKIQYDNYWFIEDKYQKE